jgi:regulator of RNase E activity RraA
MPLAVKALGSNPGKCAKAAVGEVDVPVGFGGSPSCPWRPFGDEDGITSSELMTAKSPSTAPEVIETRGTRRMLVFRESTFAPVAAVIRAADDG